MTSARRILVLGGGFAGLWSALAAARAREVFGAGQIEIVLLNDTPWHSIRVRNYEADLSETRVALDEVLVPVGVRRLEGKVTGIDVAAKTVTYDAEGLRSIGYDRLVFALGSQLARPNLPGLAAHGFDVDTYAAATRLNEHIAGLGPRSSSTALVVGGGLTGIEAAAEMPGKLRAAGVAAPRVILADHAPRIGSDMGEAAVPVIEEALAALGVERRGGVSVASVDAAGATLATGERIEAETVVWCAGMRAHPLTSLLPVTRDRLGRLPVDSFLKIEGLEAEFAAGDVASFLIDGSHSCVMSCQHGRPMGRFAGHNAVCDLLGQPMLPLRIDWYTTILDLGPWGALYTEGWNRKVVSRGQTAKRTKETINRERIYPPRTGGRQALLDAAAPTVQTPPARYE
ncbi:FAD-dependent oxidoreductase [Reyranella sp.]|uniref:NAD(P)/FAD-dependent oxidoreductase n=1 Tax=Reyranella sp. TaxID=1929291 RepID=UPI001208F18D|nr:FAD-dependent oxidoreductase [Reyranella sp.]TAJ81914.1 MAG: NAD(P)/FAD-dependent oxidoreductase [Reyranella sp.]